MDKKELRQKMTTLKTKNKENKKQLKVLKAAARKNLATVKKEVKKQILAELNNRKHILFEKVVAQQNLIASVKKEIASLKGKSKPSKK